jgi:hypothetical protein
MKQTHARSRQLEEWFLSDEVLRIFPNHQGNSAGSGRYKSAQHINPLPHFWVIIPTFTLLRTKILKYPKKGEFNTVFESEEVSQIR